MNGKNSPRPSESGEAPGQDDIAAWAETASDPRAAPGDLAHCVSHEMPESVRLAAVLNPAHNGTAARMASGDPSPVVRAAVMLSPWIDAGTRAELARDTVVMDIAARMTGDEGG